jgi:hypothetical protein
VLDTIWPDAAAKVNAIAQFLRIKQLKGVVCPGADSASPIPGIPTRIKPKMGDFQITHTTLRATFCYTVFKLNGDSKWKSYKCHEQRNPILPISGKGTDHAYLENWKKNSGTEYIDISFIPCWL